MIHFPNRIFFVIWKVILGAKVVFFMTYANVLRRKLKDIVFRIVFTPNTIRENKHKKETFLGNESTFLGIKTTLFGRQSTVLGSNLNKKHYL